MGEVEDFDSLRHLVAGYEPQGGTAAHCALARATCEPESVFGGQTLFWQCIHGICRIFTSVELLPQVATG